MKRHTYTQREANLHTHSHYCGHGSGQIADYVRAAKMAGIGLLGFSEHCPFHDERYRSTRMAKEDAPRYEADVRAFQDAEDMVVLLGYECDYHRTYHTYLSDVAGRTDYLIGAVHFLNHASEADRSIFSGPLSKGDLARYADRYCSMLQSGLFLYGAHPDAFTYNYHNWDEEAEAISRAIIECAIEEQVALEINGYGLQKLVVPTQTGFRRAYPHPQFWALAALYPSLGVVRSSDAHIPGDVAYGIDETIAIARSNGLNLQSFTLTDGGVSLR